MSEGFPKPANQNEGTEVVEGFAARHLAELEHQHGVVRGEYVPVVSKEVYYMLRNASLAADIEAQENRLIEQKALLAQLQAANDNEPPRDAE